MPRKPGAIDAYAPDAADDARRESARASVDMRDRELVLMPRHKMRCCHALMQRCGAKTLYDPRDRRRARAKRCVVRVMIRDACC